MARRTPPPAPDPISVGDVVEYAGHQWEVLVRTVSDETTAPPTVQLRLTRREEQKASTPYGKPQRYKTVPVYCLADARRCRLVAHQEGLF